MLRSIGTGVISWLQVAAVIFLIPVVPVLIMGVL